MCCIVAQITLTLPSYSNYLRAGTNLQSQWVQPQFIGVVYAHSCHLHVLDAQSSRFTSLLDLVSCPQNLACVYISAPPICMAWDKAGCRRQSVRS